MNYDILETAYQAIHTKWPNAKPRVAMICGSGWSSVAEDFNIIDSLPYENIPGLGRPGVVGHAGTLALAELHGVSTLIWQGRRHFYEGEGWTPIALSVYASKNLGVEVMLLSNSAGCVREDLKPGDLMIINDHINNMGVNPLIGPHNEVWGPRFPDQSYVYGAELRQALHNSASSQGIKVSEGVYYASTGPTYESPAEIKAYKTLGADAVGMSTLPEAILASASGMKVAGVSCITNFAAGISEHALSHEEVTETTDAAMPHMKNLVTGFVRELSNA